MSRLYAAIDGNRSGATRQGSKASGIQGHIRGWNVGVRVCGRVNDEDEDVFDVYMTGGSNGQSSDKHIARVKLVDGEPALLGEGE